MPGYYTDVALIARQARELGIKVPLMGGDGWDSAKLYEIGGKAHRRLLLLEPLLARGSRARDPGFVKKYKDTLRRGAGRPRRAGYDAAKVAIDAMEPRHGPDRRRAPRRHRGDEGLSRASPAPSRSTQTTTP